MNNYRLVSPRCFRREEGRRGGGLNGNGGAQDGRTDGWINGHIDRPKHIHFHRISWSSPSVSGVIRLLAVLKFGPLQNARKNLVPFVIRECRADADGRPFRRAAPAPVKILSPARKTAVRVRPSPECAEL